MAMRSRTPWLLWASRLYETRVLASVSDCGCVTLDHGVWFLPGVWAPTSPCSAAPFSACVLGGCVELYSAVALVAPFSISILFRLLLLFVVVVFVVIVVVVVVVVFGVCVKPVWLVTRV